MTNGLQLCEGTQSLFIPANFPSQSIRKTPPELGAGTPSAMWAQWLQAHDQMLLSEKGINGTKAPAYELPWLLVVSVSLSLHVYHTSLKPRILSASLQVPVGQFGHVWFSSIPHVGSRNTLLSETFSLPRSCLPLSITTSSSTTASPCWLSICRKIASFQDSRWKQEKSPFYSWILKVQLREGCFQYPFSHSRNETRSMGMCGKS